MIPIETSLLLTLGYADVFGAALPASRAWRLLQGRASAPEEVRRGLETLCKEGRADETAGYFHLPGCGDLAWASIERAQAAPAVRTETDSFAASLSRIESVRMVAVTGSLAAHNFRPGDDVDLLVVTSPGRLWTARESCTKLARKARRPGLDFCLNYFLTTDSLAVRGRDLFAAMEIAMACPLHGRRVYERFREENRWVLGFLPNSAGPPGPERPLGDGRESARGSFAALFDKVAWLAEEYRLALGLSRFRHRMSGNADAEFGRNVFKRHYTGKSAAALSHFADRVRRLGLHSVEKSSLAKVAVRALSGASM